MISQRMFGMVLLVVGVIVLIVGMNSSHSFSDQMSNIFTGRFTDRTTWYIVGGAVSAVLGLFMVMSGARGRMA